MVLAHSEWRPLRGVEPHRLKEARLQAHYAVQWLARAARAYIPPQPDDSHTSLLWQDDTGSFATHPLPHGARLDLRMADLTLFLRSGTAPARVQTVPLSGSSDGQARQRLGEYLSALGYDAKALDAPSPYEMPPHGIAHGAAYDATCAADALAELAAWYADASALLGPIQGQLAARKFAVSPVCCWPHHFDLATLTTLPTQNPDATGYMGAGLSPGDEYYDEPYFYVSVYPEPDPKKLPALPALGHWHTREFMAAIAPAHKILTATDQAAATGEFLDAAIAAVLAILG